MHVILIELPDLNNEGTNPFEGFVGQINNANIHQTAQVQQVEDQISVNELEMKYKKELLAC